MKIIYPIIALCILCLNGILHADTWTQKSNVSTISRGSAFAFSIANKGYVGTGADPSFLENSPKETPFDRSKLTPLFRSKVTPPIFD